MSGKIYFDCELKSITIMEGAICTRNKEGHK